MEDGAILEVRDLSVEVADRRVLSGLNLRIDQGEVHVLFGPNGSGKTTLIAALMGFRGYRVVGGEILFKGENIAKLSLNERAKMGMGISFQRPPAVKGVKLGQLAQLFSRGDGRILEEHARRLNLTEHLDREVNVGFSGGEIKRAELLQLLLQDPVMVFLDEPESGVDLENIVLIGEMINYLLGRKMPAGEERSKKEIRQERKSGLIITHTGYILEYVNADLGHVLLNGSIVCDGNPRELLRTISKCGYDECYRCLRKEREDGEN